MAYEDTVQGEYETCVCCGIRYETWFESLGMCTDCEDEAAEPDEVEAKSFFPFACEVVSA